MNNSDTQSSIEGFFWYINERQSILENKKQGEFPHTLNPVLQEYSFVTYTVKTIKLQRG